jgi:hypothetical protein
MCEIVKVFLLFYTLGNIAINPQGANHLIVIIENGHAHRFNPADVTTFVERSNLTSPFSRLLNRSHHFCSNMI